MNDLCFGVSVAVVFGALLISAGHDIRSGSVRIMVSLLLICMVFILVAVVLVLLKSVQL